jgi:hypothetical protein
VCSNEIYIKMETDRKFYNSVLCLLDEILRFRFTNGKENDADKSNAKLMAIYSDNDNVWSSDSVSTVVRQQRLRPGAEHEYLYRSHGVILTSQYP